MPRRVVSTDDVAFLLGPSVKLVVVDVLRRLRVLLPVGVHVFGGHHHIGKIVWFVSHAARVTRRCDE